jgi:hypothetical protein
MTGAVPEWVEEANNAIPVLLRSTSVRGGADGGGIHLFPILVFTYSLIGLFSTIAIPTEGPREYELPAMGRLSPDEQAEEREKEREEADG